MTTPQEARDLAQWIAERYSDRRSINESVAMLREYADLLERHERELQVWKDALWKACGDDEQTVNEYVESQRMPT